MARLQKWDGLQKKRTRAKSTGGRHSSGRAAEPPARTANEPASPPITTLSQDRRLSQIV
jgi:hypothetical protein